MKLSTANHSHQLKQGFSNFEHCALVLIALGALQQTGALQHQLERVGGGVDGVMAILAEEWKITQKLGLIPTTPLIGHFSLSFFRWL